MFDPELVVNLELHFVKLNWGWVLPKIRGFYIFFPNDSWLGKMYIVLNV